MRLLLTLLLLTTGLTGGWAQDVTFKAEAPKVVEVGEQFKLVYTLNNRGSDLRVPTLDGFSLLAGPATSMSSNTIVDNGKMTSFTEYSYTYVFMADKEGEYTIDPATVKVNGKEVSSNRLTIKVVKGSGNRQSSGQSGRQQSQQQTQSSGTISQDDLFLRLEVSRNSLYLGESLVATLKVYTKVNLYSFGRSKFPAFDGFLSEEVQIPQVQLEREEYNGQVYEVAKLNQRILFPQHAGEITIEPFELECLVRQRLNRGSGFPFDVFGGNVRDVSVMRSSRPVKITVKSLPEAGKPLGFTGAVGNISLSTSCTPDTLKANDALTYKVVFKGTGNLKLLEAPKISFPHDFEVYDPKVSRDIRAVSNGYTGTVAFEYLVIPRYAGDYTIPALNYSFFDINSKSYKTLAGKAYNIHVLKGGEGTSAPVSSSGVQSFKKEDIRVLGEDIRFIKSGNSGLKPQGIHFYRTPAYWLSFVIPFLLCIVGMLLNRRRIRANADLVRVKSKAANKMAQKRLKSASAALRAGDSALFYQEVLTALWGYVSYKLNIAASVLNRDNISEHLLRRGAPEEEVSQFIDLLDRCEYARYAPGSDREQEMDKVYRESVAVITRLDKRI